MILFVVVFLVEVSSTVSCVHSHQIVLFIPTVALDGTADLSVGGSLIDDCGDDDAWHIAFVLS